jgi:hypothetical protein
MSEFLEFGAEVQAIENLEEGNIIGFIEDEQAAQDFRRGDILGGIIDEELGNIF